MGKKARKTRWRTLSIADEHSDSEESNSNPVPRLPRPYQQKSAYYEKFGSNYSSQSTPRRRFQYDSSSKSTRSSSTTSENKITFNEDEYTRITTPRQDVLFKKGYLNKPKNYQTQTSTGTSTNSTGNSTGNGTPDHQSTDLEYESQFVFPNGFLDQHGIYYVNSYEPYPLMVYNPSTYYQEYNGKSKRYSTGSLTESMSPNNEEATSQDLSQSGGEASNNVSDYSGHHVYNMLYPGYYVNGVGPQNELANGHYQNEPTKRVKKRRRRKTSKSQTIQGDTSEYTDENDSADEIFPNPDVPHQKTTSVSSNIPSSSSSCTSHDDTTKTDEITSCKHEAITKTHEECDTKTADDDPNVACPTPIASEEPTGNTVDLPPEETQIPSDDHKTDDDKQSPEPTASAPSDAATLPTAPVSTQKCPEVGQQQKYYLKPDAEEFVPRSYRTIENTIPHPLPIKFLPPNFVPIPLMPMGDFNGPNFNHAFIPPGIPINFIPHHQDPSKIFPGYVSYVPNQAYCPADNLHDNHEHTEDPIENHGEKQPEDTNEESAPDAKLPKPQTQQNVCTNRTIDIATVVSKLQVAAKEQVETNQDKVTEADASPTKTLTPKPFKNNQRFRNSFKRNQYNRYRTPSKSDAEEKSENLPDIHSEKPEPSNVTDNVSTNTEISTFKDKNNYYRASPERLRKNWKQNTYQNGSPKRNNFVRYNNPTTYQTADISKQSPTSNGKVYSEMLKRPQNVTQSNGGHFEKQRNGFQNSPTKQTAALDKTAQNVPLSPAKSNQWISVSNRKKRKNKSAQETENGVEEFSEATEMDGSELYESYDVSLLVDVVPPTKLKTDVPVPLKSNEKVQKEVTITAVEDQTHTQKQTSEIAVKENEIEDILTSIAQNEISASLTNGEADFAFSIPEVSEIEKELLVKVEEVKTDTATVIKTEAAATSIIVEAVSMQDNLHSDHIQPAEVVEEKSKSKKKSKKGTQKPLTKKVIITDIDLSMQVSEIKTPIKKIVKKMDSNPEIMVVQNKTRLVKEEENTPVKSTVVLSDTVRVEENTTEVKEETHNAISDVPSEKKSKKKKKKPTKPVLTGSLSSSNATLSAVDDSYDLLLENTLLNESVEKTNDEISLELDKIIQKGMYGSLEEKIKSLNVEESDGFFKNVIGNISTKENGLPKLNTTVKPYDFNKIFQSSRHFLRPNSVSVEESSKLNIAFNKIELPPLDSTANEDKPGVFLENPDVAEILDIQTEPTLTEQPTSNITTIPETDDHCNTSTIEDDLMTPKYPITKAVREWMSKTRETTPEVELLKSPSTIYKEFCCNDDGTDDTLTQSSQKNLDGNSSLVESLDSDATGAGVACRNQKTDEEDEVTLFSVEQSDLLEYWEEDCYHADCNSTPNVNYYCDSGKDHGAKLCSEADGCAKCQNKDVIEQGEEAVEVYDSRYGKNEAYRQIQEEVADYGNKQKLNCPVNSANNANKQNDKLPYTRGICCSLQ